MYGMAVKLGVWALPPLEKTLPLSCGLLVEPSSPSCSLRVVLSLEKKSHGSSVCHVSLRCLGELSSCATCHMVHVADSRPSQGGY